MPAVCSLAEKPLFAHILMGGLVAAGLLLAPVPASADPGDTLGLSWEGRGGAGAAAAGVENFSAAYYNPANLGFASGPGGSVSFLQVISELQPAEAGASEGGFIEAGALLPLLDIAGLPPVWLGLAVLTPSTGFYEIDLYDDVEPAYPLFSSRERRLLVAAAAGAKLWDFLAVGAGFEMLPTVKTDVNLDLADPEGHNELHVVVGYRLSPTAGLTLHPMDQLKVGLSYRGENRTWLDLPVEVQAGGIHLEALVNAEVYYVPHRVSAGVEWTFSDTLAVEADVAWHHFTGFPSPAAEVSLLDNEGADTLGNTVSPTGFNDVFTPSIAIRYESHFGQLTAGYRYFPSPLDEQTGTTNLLHNDHHTIATGGRLPLAEGEGKPGRFLLAYSAFVDYMPKTRVFKEEVLVGNPGYPSLVYGGARYGFSLGLEVEY